MRTPEGDKSPGVLMGSGCIAGGALASIIIAFMAGGMSARPVKRVMDRAGRSLNRPAFPSLNHLFNRRAA